MSGGRREHHGRSTQRARRGVGPALAVLALVTASAVAFAKCELKKGAEIPVTMRGLRPLVPVKFNGQEGLLLVDSGAFFSTMTRANAQELGLKQGPPPIELRVTGAGGDSSEVSMTTVKELTLGGQTLHRVDFLVGGSEMESGTVGILGQNILGIADTEYDFANGVIRLFRTEDCRRQPLAYWAQNEAVEEVDIESIREARLHTIGAASVNGVKIRVMFDTGAGISMLTLRAAQRAGIKLDAPGVTPSDEAYGFGKARFKTWVAPVSSFALGGEEIKNTKLRIGDMPDFVDADMLIGPDFFLSHRVYVSNEQHKLYFTYNGGPVFNLKTGPQSTDTRAAAEPGDDTSQTATGAAVAATPVAPPAAPAAPPDAASAAATPGNAAELSRLGMAFAARHDYEHALEDLERACALAPNEPEYRYQRAFIHMQRQEGEAALSDLDAVLSMKPDHLAALMARAQMHLGRGDREAARADLDAAALAAPKPSEYRYQLAELYTRARLLPEAIAQYDLWIPAHPEDAKLGTARNARCEAKVLLNQDLDNALSDCNAAVRSNANSPKFLGNRGLARLRRGDYKKAIDDFNDALKVDPRQAWFIYGRGIAEIRLGKSAEGQADIAAAKTIRPAIAEDTAAYGIVP